MALSRIQTGLHPYNLLHRLIVFLRSKGIVPQVYSPFMKDLVLELASKYGRSISCYLRMACAPILMLISGSTSRPADADNGTSCSGRAWSASMPFPRVVAKGIVTVSKSVMPARAIVANGKSEVLVAERIAPSDIERLDALAPAGKRFVMAPWGEWSSFVCCRSTARGADGYWCGTGRGIIRHRSRFRALAAELVRRWTRMSDARTLQVAASRRCPCSERRKWN